VILDSLRSQIKMGDWYEAHLKVKDNRLQHYVNGILMSDATDRDTVMGGRVAVRISGACRDTNEGGV
jgi:hypothetical protein